jgi:predicted ArsR family transcriptional regulator
MSKAKMGELKRAAQQLGITSTALRQHGWKAASPARVAAAKADPPDWLIQAQENRRKKKTKQSIGNTRKSIAAQLGIQVRAVKEHNIKPGAIETLLSEQPEWLSTEQKRCQAQAEREAKVRLSTDLTEALVDSVHEVWFQDLKSAATAEQVAAIDARWAPEADKAKKEAQELVEHLSAEQVRARIERERDSARAAGVYRATQLARRAIGGAGG